jgi:hypothetical protein
MNEQIEKAPKEMVDVGELFKRSWALFTSKPIEHILASLIVVALGTVSLGVLIGPLCVGQIRMIDRQRRGEDIRVGEVFSGFDSFAPAFLTSLILILAVAVGLVFLVVPGLFVLAAWGFSLWFVALRGASTTEALAASWSLLKRHTGSVLVVLLLGAILGSVGASVLFATLLTAPLSFIFTSLAFFDMSEGMVEEPLPVDLR